MWYSKVPYKELNVIISVDMLILEMSVVYFISQNNLHLFYSRSPSLNLCAVRMKRRFPATKTRLRV